VTDQTVPGWRIPLATGHAFPNWTIRSHIAEGSMASVYEARYTGMRVNEMPAEAALNITGPLLAADRERLRGEYEAARRFAGHPNVVQVHDVFEVDLVEHGRCVVLVHELAEESLDDRLRRRGPLAGHDLARLAREVVTGMAALHDAGIIHSDLKPANLLWFPTGWKIADLGASAVIRTNRTVTAGTDAGTFHGGTFWYSTPEHADAILNVGTAPPVRRDADVWAFGCMLHEAACGRRPFPSASALLNGTPSIERSLPDGVRAVISACLSPAGSRPRDGRALLALLADNGLTDGSPADRGATPDGTGRSPGPKPDPGPTPDPAVRSQGAASGPRRGLLAVVGAIALTLLAVAGIVAWRSGADGGDRDGLASAAAGIGDASGDGETTASTAGLAPAAPRVGCVPLEINASLEKGELLGELAGRYNQSGRTFDGRCAEVTVHRTTSGVSMQGLLDGWDPDRLAAPTPQVWSPTSSLWVSLLRQRAREQGVTEPRVGDGPFSSIAQSPLAIAMPQPMAEAIGWPNEEISWADVLELTTNPEGWGSRGHPEWGRFVLGKDNPLRSTSGMAATVASYYAATGRSSDITVSDLDDPQVRAFVSGVESGVAHYADEALKFLSILAEVDAEGRATSYISAVVLQEQLVYLYDTGNPTGERELIDGGGATPPTVPLVALHPSDGTLMMDHPFVVLPSASAEQQAAAADFLAFVQAPEQQARFGDWGFREADGTAGEKLAATIGLPAGGEQLSLITPPSPEVLSRMLTDWSDLRKKARVVLVFDVSGSMNGEAGGGKSRIEAAKEAAIASLEQLHPDDEVGLWIFSSEERFGSPSDPAVTPYQQLLAPTPLAQSKDELVRQIQNLYADGATALYRTVRAAEESMRTGLDPGRINAIVVLSDGQNEYAADDDLDGLVADLDADRLERSVRVFAIAFGEDSDLPTLTRIAKASKASAYDARNPATISDVFVSVLSNF